MCMRMFILVSKQASRCAFGSLQHLKTLAFPSQSLALPLPYLCVPNPTLNLSKLSGHVTPASSPELHPSYTRDKYLNRGSTVTYDHRLRRIGHPVRSAIHKPQIGRLVVGWVTTSEYLLLYVF
ncbi:hypothetical protein L207DRAFT_21207 [Hyaloscypha variabilis F]|uniref:Uncharacterized protein n=1 Tax=Hyaloscypha variabilis (strain UAMH 11265 / GT02V1 / F) TaxID=1149755 RepID=A0A2J6RLJ9_HYAVF|nr:hypothetical protein L207DRAFT_21207 [Hyaloscypha variabilis F]